MSKLGEIAALGCMMLCIVFGVYLFSEDIVLPGVNSQPQDTTIYEGVVKERYRDTQSTAGVGRSVGKSGFFLTSNGSKTSYYIIVNDEEHKISKSTWVKLDEGTVIQYQKSSFGTLDNITIVDGETAAEESSVSEDAASIESAKPQAN